MKEKSEARFRSPMPAVASMSFLHGTGKTKTPRMAQIQITAHGALVRSRQAETDNWPVVPDRLELSPNAWQACRSFRICDPHVPTTQQSLSQISLQ